MKQQQQRKQRAMRNAKPKFNRTRSDEVGWRWPPASVDRKPDAYDRLRRKSAPWFPEHYDSILTGNPRMSDYEPLLVRFPESGDSIDDCDGPGWITVYRRARRATRKFLSSKAKHHLTLSLIVLDVAGILSGITIALVTCELHRQNEKWVALTMRGLSIFSLVLSCMFLQELILCLWVEGLQYLTKWLHILDAFVIVVSFAVDLIEHGIAEEIASLVIILRLWRFVKIVDEFSVEASEQMECMHRRIEDLETENAHLQRQLGRRASRDEESTMS